MSAKTLKDNLQELAIAKRRRLAPQISASDYQSGLTWDLINLRPSILASASCIYNVVAILRGLVT